MPETRSLTEEQVVAGACLEDLLLASPHVGVSGSVVVTEPSGDHYLTLREAIIGSDPDCDIVLNDGTVEPRHARLTVSQSMATIESAEAGGPVFVNGRPVRGWTVLKDGDRITVGGKHLLIFQCDQRSDHPTLRPPSMSAACAKPRPSELQTRGVNPPAAALGRAADKLLAVGRIVQAEDLLGPTLTSVLEQAREGRHVPDAILNWVVGYAFKLARDTRRGRWLDFVLELHLAAEQRMASKVAMQFERLSGFARDFDRRLLQTYEDVAETSTTLAPKHGCG